MDNQPYLDGERHDRLRGLFRLVLTRRAMPALEEAVRRTQALVEEFRRGEEWGISDRLLVAIGEKDPPKRKKKR